MTWTYLGNDPLARAASKLYARRTRPCALSPYIFMTDPKRTPDVLRNAAGLPKGSTLIYRHFGADNKVAIATALRQICFVRDVQFLIARDEELAMVIGADGLHLPEKYLPHAPKLRVRYPDWLLSGAVHSAKRPFKTQKVWTRPYYRPYLLAIARAQANPSGLKHSLK